MEIVEKFIYEAKPYVILAFGLYAMFAQPSNKFLFTLAFVLLFCAGAILSVRFRSRKKTTLEAIFYESQPFLYLGLALYVILFQNFSRFAVGCALLLMFCGGIIFNWRYHSRNQKTKIKMK